jgi:hypothetical protein
MYLTLRPVLNLNGYITTATTVIPVVAYQKFRRARPSSSSSPSSPLTLLSPVLPLAIGNLNMPMDPLRPSTNFAHRNLHTPHCTTSTLTYSFHGRPIITTFSTFTTAVVSSLVTRAC